MALTWINDIGIRVGAYMNSDNDMCQVTVGSGMVTGPSIQMVKELNQILQIVAIIPNHTYHVVEDCRNWLENLKAHWWKNEIEIEWLQEVGYDTRLSIH